MQKFYRLVNICIPPLIMLITAYVAFSGMLGNLASKSLIINALLLIYPALFFLQGFISGLLKSNVFLTFAVSIVTFLMIVIVWLNMSALLYIVVYVLAGTVGYGIVRLLQKINEQKQT